MIKTIRQMESSLDDTKANDNYDLEDEGLKITYPLLTCIQVLKEKHHTISKLHRERYEQVKKLVEALESYASHLEPTFVSIKLPPTSPNAKIPTTFDLSPTYVSSLDNEFSRVYQEYNKRVATVTQLADDIISLWSELGTPQAQVDSQIVECAREAPEQLGLHQDDLTRLKAKRDKLVEEKKSRERRLKELKSTVEGLWDRLGVEESERKAFLASNRGCGLRIINEFEDELSRLNELKRQNLHLFVEDARFKLQELWDGLYFSEEEMLEFAPAFSDVYSDALLSAHEQEIARLEALKGQRAPILAAIDKHRSLIKDREDLAASSQDASRLMLKPQKGEKRDPTRLLREEKMRKRIAKDLPKVEVELRKTLEAWEDEYGRPFCVHGQRYLDELEAAAAKPAPPRSKTPNALAPAQNAPKSGGRSAGAQSRAGTLRGQPPPRSHTPSSIQRNPLASSVMSSSVMSSSVMSSSVSQHSSGFRSPSKIPGASRLPMSNMPHGNNSPERRLRPAQSQATIREDFGKSTIRGQMGPPRAPPPKMKDLFMPPTPTPSNKENRDLERSASVVRHVEPEDVYDDSRETRPYMSSTIRGSARPHYERGPPSQESVIHHVQPSRTGSRFDYPTAPSASISRQTSNTSSVTSGSAVSGSENWETYTDASDNDEADASDAHYARMKAAQMRQKRQMPSPGKDIGPGKKFRGAHMAVVDENAVEGSEAGWTDDGDVGDTY